MSYLTIRIIRIGQATVEVTVETGSTVAAAIAAAGASSQGAQIRFNGIIVDGNTRLNENGDIMIAKAIQGA